MQLVSKTFNLCGPDPGDPDPPTLQTDGWTTCNRNTALCTLVHHAVKNNTEEYKLMSMPSLPQSATAL